VPVHALDWIQETYKNLPIVNWYEELTSAKRSYETKLKWEGRWHSDEFDTTGLLKDVEITLHKCKLLKRIRHELQVYFGKKTKLEGGFDRRISKIISVGLQNRLRFKLGGYLNILGERRLGICKI